MSVYSQTRSSTETINTPVTQQPETGNATAYAGIKTGGDFTVTDGGAVQAAIDLSRGVIEQQREASRRLAALADGALKSAIQSNAGITENAISGIRAAAGDRALKNAGDTAATVKTVAKWTAAAAGVGVLFWLFRGGK